jgi:YfiH family protein
MLIASLMLQKSIKNFNCKITHSAIEFVQWPVNPSTVEKNVDGNILAIQTTRVAPNDLIGEQTSPYQGFNLGLHVGDCAQQVENNRSFLQELLPKNAKIQWLEQVHGNEVAEISKVSTQTVIADAAVTREKNTCLAIMTADCLPILLMSKSGNEIAAIHGGWRPLASNIITKTLDKMKTPAVDIYAWLGPCISKSAFEVGKEVRARFVQNHDSFSSAFIAKNNGQYLADLHKIAKMQLERLGINQISTLPECTFSNDKYYSYRKNSITGRMATLICIL